MGASIVKISILGSLPGGEVWSVNPVFFLHDEPASVTFEECQAIATAVRAITIPTGLRALMSAQTFFTGIRAEARDRNGVLEAAAEAAISPTIPGSSATVHPYQTSSVTSLRTATPGPSGRGRLYWPATGAPLDATTLRMSSATAASALSGVKTYMAAIQAAVAVSAGPCSLAVWSRKQTNFHGVNLLLQGDILDTQRRRRDTLTEGYSTLVYP